MSRFFIAPLRCAFLLAVIGSLYACVPSHSPGGGPGGSPETLESFFSDSANAVCGNPCAGTALLVASFSDSAGCRSVMGGFMSDVALPITRRAIANGTAVFHPENAAGCLALLRSTTCSELSNDLTFFTCNHVIEGTVAGGGACEQSFECEGDGQCELGASCPGHCAPRPARGQPCGGEGGVCASGLTCVDDVCVGDLAAGSECSELGGASCSLGLVCSGQDPESGAPGHCVSATTLTPAALGATCNPIGAQPCEAGLSCALDFHSAQFVCATLLAHGAPCTFGVPDPCAGADRCIDTGDTGIGTCDLPPSAGTPCDATGISPCHGELVCLSRGVCGERVHLGGACGNLSDCFSGNCSAGVCVEPPMCAPLGE